MAKKRKYRKKPKKSASLETWQKYAAHKKEVDAHNRKIEADKKKKAALINKL